MEGREKVKPGADSQPALLEKHQGDHQAYNVPIRQMNRYQQNCIPSQHTYYGRVWNLIQACDVQSSDQKVYISTPPSPKVENFQMKIDYPAGDRTSDLLNQRQTCYHLSQRVYTAIILSYFAETLQICVCYNTTLLFTLFSFFECNVAIPKSFNLFCHCQMTNR